jgi:hypothetical protein
VGESIGGQFLPRAVKRLVTPLWMVGQQRALSMLQDGRLHGKFLNRRVNTGDLLIFW